MITVGARRLLRRALQKSVVVMGREAACGGERRERGQGGPTEHCESLPDHRAGGGSAALERDQRLVHRARAEPLEVEGDVGEAGALAELDDRGALLEGAPELAHL